MGTNYYYHASFCTACKRPTSNPIHIGKSSAGWTFALHVYPTGDSIAHAKIESLSDWMTLFARPDSIIVDEYGETLDADKMLIIIAGRNFEHAAQHPEKWYSANCAVVGPNNLARRKITPDFCIGHGIGTWDLCVGSDDSW